jgi:hypothetical protein
MKFVELAALQTWIANKVQIGRNANEPADQIDAHFLSPQHNVLATTLRLPSECIAQIFARHSINQSSAATRAKRGGGVWWSFCKLDGEPNGRRASGEVESAGELGSQVRVAVRARLFVCLHNIFRDRMAGTAGKGEQTTYSYVNTRRLVGAVRNKATEVVLVSVGVPCMCLVSTTLKHTGEGRGGLPPIP